MTPSRASRKSLLVASAILGAAVAACTLLRPLDEYESEFGKPDAASNDASDDQTNVGDASVSDVDAAGDPGEPLFVYRATRRTTDAGNTVTDLEPYVVYPFDPDSARAHSIGCVIRNADQRRGSPDAGAGPAPYSMYRLTGHYPTNGDPALAAWVANDEHLVVGSEDTRCEGEKQPVRIDREATGSNRAMPRFSPNGLRIAYYDIDFDRITALRTSAIDGGAPHLIREAPDGAAINASPPAWEQSSLLFWQEVNDTTTFWRRKTDNPTPQEPVIAFACARAELYELYQSEPFTIPNVSDRLVHVARAIDDTNISLYVQDHNIPAPPAGKSRCMRVSQGGHRRGFSKIGTTVARDIAIAPNRSTLAFAGTPNNGALAIAFVEAADTELAPRACSVPDDEVDAIGPIWLRNGTALAWTEVPRVPSRSGAVKIATVSDGGCTDVKTITLGADAFVQGATNDGATCAMSPGSLSASSSSSSRSIASSRAAWSWMTIGGFGIVLLARRRLGRRARA